MGRVGSNPTPGATGQTHGVHLVSLEGLEQGFSRPYNSSCSHNKEKGEFGGDITGAYF